MIPPGSDEFIRYDLRFSLGCGRKPVKEYLGLHLKIRHVFEKKLFGMVKSKKF
jgi:hypothetical protein